MAVTKKKRKLILTARIGEEEINMETTADFPGKIETESDKESAENLIRSFSIMMGTYKTEEAEAMFITPEGRHSVHATRNGDIINVYKKDPDEE